MITAPALWQRAALVQAIRQFFIDRDYLEVDTPIRTPAPAPEAHIEPEPSGDCFLQTSPELYMKRLLARGNPKIFQICKCFRKGERGSKHLSEFTMLEWYRSGTDYFGLMEECEELIKFLCNILDRGNTLSFTENTISVDAPWERLSVHSAFKRYAPISLDTAFGQDTFDETLVEHIEPHLGINQPTFLYDYPASLGALAKLKQNQAHIAERFELYISGLELANGFSELTDTEEQRKRFEMEQEKMKSFGRPPGPMPERFLEELPYMEETAGIALGVDRLAMIFAGTQTIDDVIPFRPEEL